ncbi:acylneuraminate cytidylyltransferase family protein [Diplocloster agilis]|uniref:Acylneuraminate cytidylyltransferase family protein n=1 Tax=Diplocloster agilis TaxID=2850323 RepID=A0A949NDT9_9FIRM|nr:acylneuraminate cytidylyltransferase family protein [Diplocloster agilis]
MNILCLIPARGGSKGLPRKNVKNLCGKPLIGWTIEAAKKSKYINEVYVSSDDKEILSVAASFKAKCIQRPSPLASDQATSIDVTLHALRHYQENQFCLPDFVLLLQCTSPLRTEKHIDDAIELYQSCEKQAEAVISVKEAPHPPQWLRLINEEGFIEPYIKEPDSTEQMRQNFNKVYMPNGALYFIKTEIFLDQKTFQPQRTIPYIMDEVSSVDIDHLLDFELASLLINALERNTDDKS